MGRDPLGHERLHMRRKLTNAPRPALAGELAERVGDRHPAPHEANLFDLQAKYAEVISLVEAERYLDSV